MYAAPHLLVQSFPLARHICCTLRFKGMDKLFEHAPSIIREASRSALGVGSLMVLSGSVAGVLMFKDAKDEHVKLYAFLALLGAFLLLLFTLARSTKKVALQEQRRMAAGANPTGVAFEVGGMAGGIVRQPVQKARSSGMAGCLVGLVIFGVIGIFLIFVVVGAAMMDLSWNDALKPGTATASGTGAGAPISSAKEAVSGYVTDATLVNLSGHYRFAVYPTSPGFGALEVAFEPSEIVEEAPGTDALGNPVTYVTVDIEAYKARTGMGAFGPD